MKFTTKALVAIATIAMTATVAQAAPSFNKMQGGQTYVGAKLNNAFGAGGFGNGLAGSVYGGYEIMPNVSIEAEVSPIFASGAGNSVTMIGYSVAGAYRHSLQSAIQAPVYLKGKFGIGGAYVGVRSGLESASIGGVTPVWGFGVGYDVSPSLSVELDANIVGGGLGIHKKF